MITIRKATDDDLPALLAIGRQHYEGTFYSGYAPMKDETCIDVFKTVIKNGVFLVAEAEGRVVGMLGFLIVPFMFNVMIPIASEVVFFVDKDSTGQGAAKALLAACEAEAAKYGVKAIQMHTVSPESEALAGLYESRGFVHSENSYTKASTKVA